MTQLAFDFDALVDSELDGLDVVDWGGKPHHILRRDGKIIGYRPVGMVVQMLSCGVHEDTPKGREYCAEDCFGFICPTCGEDGFGAFPYRLNHDKYGEPGDCVARGLKINHVWYAYQLLLDHENPDSEPKPYTNCWVRSHGHKDSYKRAGWPVTCLIATLVEDYERCVRMRVDVDRLPPIDLQKLKEQL